MSDDLTRPGAPPGAELASCRRRCADLEAQLHQARRERENLRRDLQARLLQVRLASEHRLAAASAAAERAMADREAEHRQALLACEQERDACLLACEQERDACLQAHEILRVTAEERQAQVQSLTDRLAALGTTCAEQAREHARQVAAALATRRELEERLAEQERHRREREQELRGVYASLSWRLTAPLRGMKRIVLRRRHPAA